MAKKKKRNSADGSGDMDPIKLPDKKKIRALNEETRRGSAVNQYAEALFSTDKSRHQGSFERAIAYEDPGRNLTLAPEEEEEEEEEDITEFAARNVPKATGLNRGVKLGGQYVKKKTIVIWCVIAVSFLLAMMFAFPPIMTDDVDNSKVLEDQDIFKDMGMTELKAYASAHYYVHSQKAFNSEKSENYRVVELAFNARNLSPFTVEIPKMVVTKVDPMFEDHIAYVKFGSVDENGKDVPEKIPAFSSKKITVQILVEVSEMSEKEFNDAITSMILSTEGMNKKVFGLSVPCVPFFIFVSDNISLDLNK